MPWSAPKPCVAPGCPRLAERGKRYCSRHAYLENKNRGENHDPRHSKKYGKKWQQIRMLYFSTHPYCERCAKGGVMREAEEVHHIIPLNDGGTNDFSNLQSLCRKCHAETHAELGTRKRKQE